MDEELATFGGGCFWCVEAVFKDLKGVLSVDSGYAGGATENPTYKEVCTGRTGHAEVCQIRFDPQVISYSKLLEVFWKIHDPTTMNRQGEDVGTQYRSVIFAHDERQAALADELLRRLDESRAFGSPMVTSVERYTRFWKAEEHHQDYFARNPDQAYCKAVVRPKLEKFRRVFGDRLK